MAVVLHIVLQTIVADGVARAGVDSDTIRHVRARRAVVVHLVLADDVVACDIQQDSAVVVVLDLVVVEFVVLRALGADAGDPPL